MTHITVHDGEKEGEGDHLEDGGVNLSISGILVGVDGDLMELQHIVGLEARGRDGTLAISIAPPRELCSAEILKFLSNNTLLFRWDPHVADECAFVQFKHVHGVVDGFFFGYEPLVDLKCRDASVLLVSGLVSGRVVHIVEVVLELVHRCIVQAAALFNF